MNISSRKEALLLFFGDIVILFVSLWLTLFIRYRRLPFEQLWIEHLTPFILLFGIWICIFFIFGLYEKHTQILTKTLPDTLITTQIINAIIGFLFFYLTPWIQIAPKINLILYVFISTTLLYLWRNNAQSFINLHQRDRAIIIGNSSVVQDLIQEINGNPRYRFHFLESFDVSENADGVMYERIHTFITRENIKVVVFDMYGNDKDKIISNVSHLMFSGVRFLDIAHIYEEVFDKIPSEILTYRWFFERTSVSFTKAYHVLKRGMDIILSSIVGILFLPFIPLIALGIKKSSPGPILFYQTRIGEKGKHIQIPKFRTMVRCDTGQEALVGSNQVTPFGNLLRRTRFDEFPQLWSVIKGDLSLIGPRPEIPELVNIYEKEIPYYSMRHLMKPGLSGWAQLYGEHSHGGVNINSTINKLSYDLFYFKNRSLMLDFKIALKTIKKILTRSGK